LLKEEVGAVKSTPHDLEVVVVGTGLYIREYSPFMNRAVFRPKGGLRVQTRKHGAACHATLIIVISGVFRIFTREGHRVFGNI
jgi:hypothetical protein